MALAKKVNGRLMALEHRYYGQSQPYTNWSVENLRCHNSAQALADIAEFIKYQNSLYTQEQHQWVVVGGSYPGGLSAWFRSLYPELASVAWSSSGVIHAVEDFTNFDLDVYTATLTKGNNCTDTVKSLTSKIDQIFEEDNLYEKASLFE